MGSWIRAGFGFPMRDLFPIVAAVDANVSSPGKPTGFPEKALSTGSPLSGLTLWLHRHYIVSAYAIDGPPLHEWRLSL